MNKIIIGNWKLNPAKFKDAKKIADEIKKVSSKLKVSVVICPPIPFLPAVTPSKRLFLGAQDVSMEKEGAHTGEVGVAQLKSVGVSHIIIGHSERRAKGETSDSVAKKAVLALKAKITPIICIGEKERHQDGSYWEVIRKEVHASLAGIPKAFAKKVIIAYEPIWAIGTAAKGAMNSEDVNESAIFIKKVLSEIYGTKVAHDVSIVYGGSVDDANAVEIAATEVSGFLVGRQSLKPKSFLKIASTLA